MNKILYTIEEVQQIEKVSYRCSEKYIPIKTTSFIRTLKEFTFQKAIKYSTSKDSSAHIALLNKNDSDSDVHLLIENSFDRRVAFSLSFYYNGMMFNHIKTKHIGQNAKSISDLHKDISFYYDEAVKTIKNLDSAFLSDEHKKNIKDIAFKTRGYPNADNAFFNIKNDVSALTYITTLVNDIEQGNILKLSTGKAFKQVNRKAIMVAINSRIFKYIKNNMIEQYV